MMAFTDKNQLSIGSFYQLLAHDIYENVFVINCSWQHPKGFAQGQDLISYDFIVFE